MVCFFVSSPPPIPTRIDTLFPDTTLCRSMTVDYLSGQVRAGVEAVQRFDSWAGSRSPDQFEQWVIAPSARIVSSFRARHPDVPVIGFPKGAGGKLIEIGRAHV